MRPDQETNNAFIYCLAIAAERSGVQVIFTLAMSNHHHTGIVDPDANYPVFIEHFHKLFAKCQNALRGRRENFWSVEQTNVVRLVDPNDVVNKMTYALVNPVKARLVEHAKDWPGVSSFEALSRGASLVATRPRHFFREEGPMPDRIRLSLTRPPGFEAMSAQEFAAMVLERIRVVEETVAAERGHDRVLGRRGVLRQEWTDRPTTLQPRRDRTPDLAASSKWRRFEALLYNRAFRDAYIAAREALVTGVRDVLFPAGTYWLRRFAHAPCVPCAPS